MEASGAEELGGERQGGKTVPEGEEEEEGGWQGKEEGVGWGLGHMGSSLMPNTSALPAHNADPTLRKPHLAPGSCPQG